MITKDNYFLVPVELGQDIFDIAIQEYGSLEYVFKVVEDNALTIDEKLDAGSLLQFETKRDDNHKEVRDFFKRTATRVNCHDFYDDTNYILQEDTNKILQTNDSGLLHS